MLVPAGALVLHDLVDPLHQVLDDAVGSHLHLQACRDRVRLNTGNRLACNALNLLLLLRRPLWRSERSA